MDSMQEEISSLLSGRVALQEQIVVATEQARRGTNTETERKKELRNFHEALVVDVQGLRDTVAEMEVFTGQG
jgi:hypothetical protein